VHDYIKRGIQIYHNEGIKTLAMRSWKFWSHSLYPQIKFSVLNRIRPKIHSIRYDAPSNPYQLIWVDPDLIELYNDKLKYKSGLARIKSGDWDKDNKQLEEHRTYRGLKQRFEQGLDWRDTDYIPEDQELYSKWQNTDEFVSKKCKYIDLLYDRIKKEGYSPNFTGNSNKPPREKVPTRDLEPLVFIDREGKFILHEGFHRVTIAQILDVKQIPVYVIIRHVKWQKIRDKLATAESLDSIDDDIKSNLNHPDFNDIEIP